MMGIGAVVNALAFSGSNFLFSNVGNDKEKIEAERVRHDRAIEDLNKAHEEWSKNRSKYLDLINEHLRKESAATQTFRNVDVAMREYYIATREQFDLPENLKTENEPKLSDYYEPSEAQKDRELIWIVGGTVVVVVVGYNLFY